MLTRCLLLAVLWPSFNAHANTDPVTKEQAMQALRDLGADVPDSSGRCAGCHDPNLYTLNKWLEQGSAVQFSCLYDIDRPGGMSALQRVNCLRDDPTDPRGRFSAKRLGLFAAAAHLQMFKKLFKEAYPEDAEQKEHKIFVEQVSMPMHEDKLGEVAFDNIRQWAYHPKTPAAFLEDIVGGPIDAPRDCQAYSSPAMQDYLRDMHQRGWSARNAQDAMPMFACEGQGQGLNCFKQRQANGTDVFPIVQHSPFANNWANGPLQHVQRLLLRLNFKTSYWTRISADGRFIGNGMDISDRTGFTAKISDLRPRLDPDFNRSDIDIMGNFDPSFFPDGSGFMFQGRFNGFCGQQVLEDRQTTRIDFTQPGCSRADVIPLYQSVGASLDGADYFAAAGVFTGDDGHGDDGHVPQWLKRSFLQVVRLLFDGTTFQPVSSAEKWTPFVGDYQLSPSTGLLVGRIAGELPGGTGIRQLGYSINRLKFDNEADSTHAIEVQEIAKTCAHGGKATFSYDERFIATYATVEAGDFAEFGYADAQDAEFLQRVGSSNIYLMDMQTGLTHRLTDMRNGHRAKFPSFRSDGWLYYLVSINGNQQWIAASDAAIRLL